LILWCSGASQVRPWQLCAYQEPIRLTFGNVPRLSAPSEHGEGLSHARHRLLSARFDA
jgi:hypothetical protein